MFDMREIIETFPMLQRKYGATRSWVAIVVAKIFRRVMYFMKTNFNSILFENKIIPKVARNER